MISRAGMIGGTYRPLSIEQIERIHRATLEVLARTGVEVNDVEGLEIFRAGGAQVDEDRALVRFPEGMLEEVLKTAPSEVVLCGQAPENDLILEGARVYLGTGGTALNILDFHNGQKRRALLRDLEQICALVERLDNIHFIVLPTYPNDLPKEEVDFHRFKAGLENSHKHVMGGVYTIEGLREAIGLARQKAGGKEGLKQRPLISVIACVMSPLKMDRTYTQLALEAVREGIPLVCPTEPLCGATAPITLAGNLVLTNAETLSAAALVQLAKPGHPVLYGAVSSIADPRTMQYLSGAVEMGLLNAAAAQLAQFYHLPFYATAGMSDSKLPDAQAGYEKAITTLLVALAGANFIHDTAGLLEFATTVALEQYVIDDEINGMVMRALEGIRVDEESLAVEVIERVGPGGDFMSDDHTLANMRKEFFMPVTADRQLRERWEAAGSKDAAQRARERVQQILGEIPEGVCAG